MKKTLLTGIITISLMLWTGVSAIACPPEIKTPLQALALFNNKSMSRLENENRLAEICPGKRQDCVASALAPETDHLNVYNRPEGDIVASLTVTYTPGEEMKAALIKKDKPLPFTPTIYDSDWGYGPWFHATLLEQRGEWQKIVLPDIQSGWIKMPDPQILFLNEKNTVYSLAGRKIVILKENGKDLTVRDAQPADMWCEAGEPPALQPYKEQTLHLGELYDDNLELLLKPAYTRGC